MENSFNEMSFLKITTLKSGKHELKILEGTINLSTWAGFQSRQGAYNAIDSSDVSDGTIKIFVGEYVNAEELVALSAEQVNAYKFLQEHQSEIQESILNALLIAYKKLQIEYGYEEDNEDMPAITAASEFKKYIGLSTIHLFSNCKDNIAYVGYEFGCSWDVEHGLGILTHKERVIEIGAADTAFDTWLAEKDIDPIKADEELKKYKDMPLVAQQKPWWKFW